LQALACTHTDVRRISQRAKLDIMSRCRLLMNLTLPSQNGIRCRTRRCELSVMDTVGYTEHGAVLRVLDRRTIDNACADVAR
jgi:hypothetical protein